MPERGYRYVLRGTEDDPRDILRVRIVIDRGAVVDFLAQYETIIDNERYPVVRYDGSHGRGHRDVLDWGGVGIDKEWMPEHMNLAATLTHGIQDIKEHWERYREAFMARQPNDRGGR